MIEGGSRFSMGAGISAPGSGSVSSISEGDTPSRALDNRNVRRICATAIGKPAAKRAPTMRPPWPALCRSEEHTSELQSLMRISYAVFCLKKKTENNKNNDQKNIIGQRPT